MTHLQTYVFIYLHNQDSQLYFCGSLFARGALFSSVLNELNGRAASEQLILDIVWGTYRQKFGVCVHFACGALMDFDSFAPQPLRPGCVNVTIMRKTINPGF